MAACLLTAVTPSAVNAAGRWTPEQANKWYDAQPWLVGCNFAPSSAINQLEMWQAETFDPGDDRPRARLGRSRSACNTVRVFLHDVPWKEDREGFYKRLDQFLEIAAKHKIRPMIVFFDGVWDPDPQSGLQRRPRTRRAQQRLGAKPGPRRSSPTTQSRMRSSPTSPKCSSVTPMTSAFSRGTCSTSPTTPTPTATARWS